MDCSLPGPSIHRILQARMLEWLPCPPPGDLPDPGIEPTSPALQVDSLPIESPGKPLLCIPKMWLNYAWFLLMKFHQVWLCFAWSLLVSLRLIHILPCMCSLCYAKLLQLCPTLCNPKDCNLPGSSVHRTSQARKMEWVVISFPRGSSRPRDQTLVSQDSLIGREVLYN